ncbi:MAG TPA: hypothetical protein VMQ78_03990 [Candidatus Limnocylindria bacterium]|nr:hypothetical protein [Candidatus Limnocylindria bacterium]
MVSLAFAAAPAVGGTVNEILFLWVPAGAAVVAALVVLTGAGSVLGWISLGLILFAGAISVRAMNVTSLLLLLYVAFLPLLPRPRGSLALGIGLSVLTALLWAAYLYSGYVGPGDIRSR